jgi:DNA-binding CsgD family transcriptional regulator
VDTATSLYLAALERLDSCPQRDRFLEAHCLGRLAVLAVERLDAATWAVVSRRLLQFNRSDGGFPDACFSLAISACAYACDVDGDLDRAALEARAAEDLAVSAAARVVALCARAMVARHAGEPVSHRDHLRAALGLFDACAPAEFCAEQSLVPLDVALEATCGGFHDEARAALLRYREPQRELGARPGDDTAGAYAIFVKSQIFRARGEEKRANAGFEAAFAAFRSLKHTRRSIVAALQITRRRGDSGYYDGYVSLAVERLAPQSWIRRQAADRPMRGILNGLTATQRELIELVCSGHTNGEIAARRARSEHTVRNQIARLFEVLGTRSRAELTAVAIRHRLDHG